MAKAKSDVKSDNELLQDISIKMDRIIGLMAIDGKSLDEQIVVLKGLDFDWKTIGTFVGLKPDAARMRYSKRTKK